MLEPVRNISFSIRKKESEVIQINLQRDMGSIQTDLRQMINAYININIENI